MSFISKILSGGIGELIEKGADVVDRFVTTGEEKEKAKREMETLVRGFEMQLLNAEYQDRDSARKREMEFVKAGKTDWFMWVVGVVGLASFVFICYVLAYHDIPQENKELFIHLIGLVEGVVVGIFSYYYGSSKGSKDKSQDLASKIG